ncbi:hypothetical protein A9Q79_02210 [Methylophaga sp. 42_25_T18]|nr:hypothetical protein A9Q79_02210 [Methylophaga sp. 42_25_T18]OUR86837.1 hypothetical protein A9Q92_05130 [Methylophaga sp. 42_8_T64]
MDPSDALKHFLNFNRTRIARLRALSPIAQQPFFELLPLIFHTNSTALPGFINKQIPAGISDFQPKDADLDAAQKFNNSFAFKRQALRHYPILGVYLINDNGGINFPDNAKFDLWLVHSNQEAEHDQKLLKQKLIAVQSWAESLSISLHVRLINVDSLSQQPLTAYDLDRFYLHGLVLAGSIPLWWGISPEQEADYQQVVQKLKEQRRLSQNTFIDFGKLPSEIDAQDLFDQSYQLLNAAMDRGMESTLDLLYQQHILELYPNIPWLSQTYKQTVYQGKRDPLQLDCRVLKLHAITEASSTSVERLFLAQQSLYVLFKERLSQTVAHARYPWRRDFCRDLVYLWQWSEEQIEALDSRSKSHYRQCVSEYDQVRSLLFDVGHSIVTFAAQQNLTVELQKKQLIQKQQLHNVAPDIVSHLPFALLPASPEEHVYLHRTTQAQGWAVSDSPITTTTPPLYQADSLLQVLAWAISNQILAKSTRLKIADETGKIAINTVLQLVQLLLNSPIATSIGAVTDQSLASKAELKQVLIFVNLEQRPKDKLSQQGLVLSSLNSDPLNHAVNRQSLVLTVEALAYTSWGQWHYLTQQQVDSPLQMLASLIRWQPTNITAGALSCWCPSESHGQAISKRISTLYSEVIAHYMLNSASGNYHLKISDQHYRIQWQAGRCDVRLLAKQKELAQTLATANTEFSASKFDHSMTNSVLLNQLLRLQSPDQITLFLQLHKKIITLYLIDELGNIIKQQFEDLTESTLITHFYHFLNTIKLKNTISRLRFYRLNKKKDHWTTNAIAIQTPPAQGYLPVTIEMESANDNAQCKICCGAECFQGAADDKRLFDGVRELVLRLRKSHQRYPLYITELTFNQENNLTTNQYLLQKQRLEHLLNKD